MVERSLQLDDSQPTTVIWPAEVSGTLGVRINAGCLLLLIRNRVAVCNALHGIMSPAPLGKITTEPLDFVCLVLTMGKK